MPSAVKGLMKAEAPCLAVAPCGNNKQSAILATRYCAYIPKVRVATRRPTHASASAPAAMTTPAPSLPTSIPWSRRPATAASRDWGTTAVAVGRSAVPPALKVAASAGPSNIPRSEGLIGAASTRTTTSSAAGSGTTASSSDNSSFPPEVIFDRNSSPDRFAMGSSLHWNFVVKVRSGRDRVNEGVDFPAAGRGNVSRLETSHGGKAARLVPGSDLPPQGGIAPLPGETDLRGRGHRGPGAGNLRPHLRPARLSQGGVTQSAVVPDRSQ